MESNSTAGATGKMKNSASVVSDAADCRAIDSIVKCPSYAISCNDYAGGRCEHVCCVLRGASQKCAIPSLHAADRLLSAPLHTLK